MSDNTLEKQCKGPCGRTLPATSEYFHRSKNGKYRLSGECKVCKSERNKNNYLSSKGESRRAEDNPLSEKYCTACGLPFPLTSTYFNHSKVTKDGWYPWCKVCRKEYDREYMKRPGIHERKASYYKVWAEDHKEQGI